MQRRNLRQNIAATCLCLFCAYVTANILPPTLHRKFHRGFVQKHLVTHSLLCERFEEVSPENSTTRLRDREVGEREGGCGIHRAGSGRQCKISLRSLSRDCMPVALGQLTYFLRTLGLIGLQLMGINFKVPIVCKQAMKLQTNFDRFTHVF